jgi:hypothetical protein
MKRCYILAIAASVAAAVLAPVTVTAADAYAMRSGQAVKMDRAGRLPELAAMAVAPAAPAAPTAEVPNIRVPPRLWNVPNVDAPDALGPQSPVAGPKAPTPMLSFGGFDSDDNSDLFGFRIMPPDTQGDVGLEHYVQWNNLGFKIFDKAGNLLNGPLGSPGNIFWAGFGGTCETENDGDPIVLYDHVAGRWFFSQFEVSSGLGLQCVAVSDGEDPAGPYTRYAFPISIAGFNDYPKIGLWTSADGTQSAYHVTTNEFSPFQGVNLTALDRDAILAGAPATFVQFTIPPAAGTDPFAFSLQPGHLEGPVLPSAGTCETYIQAFDTETWGAAGDPDGYRTWEFCVDFDTPANSTLTEYPFIAAGFEFDANMCGFGNCVPQQGTSQLLDTLSQFTMYRFAVRDVEGTFKGVVSHTVDLGGDLGGVQWAQFDLSGAAPALADIGQLDVGDGLHRWMPSIAQDQDGNIALGYSRSGTTAFPSFYYTGRLADAAPGTLQPETVCVDGTGFQTGGGRWGDYASVGIDPADDCTFWLTNEYVETTGSFQWDTQICTFKFPDCGGACVPDETTEATCDDGVDNDCDGQADCSDSDCSADPACVVDPCGDGVCDPLDDEDCFSCPDDCPSGEPVQPGCGNGICEPGRGEDCLTCAADCAGKQNGKPANRYCCGAGGGESPVDCNDPRCTTGGNQCSDFLPGGFCCGDSFCDGGDECTLCGVDCSDQSICDAPTCDLGQPGDSCTDDGDCCSAKCKGKPGAKTCN